MSATLEDRYWSEEFQVTKADLDRIATYIRKSGQSHDLTVLVQRIVRGRLAHGSEASTPAQPVWAKDPSVRLWDPAGEWKPGDHTIIWTWSSKAKRGKVMIGEIIDADSAFVHIAVEDRQRPRRIFRRAAAGSPDAIKWHEVVRKAVGDLKQEPSRDGQIDGIILRHGERIASQLKDALHADKQFVRLEGRWFLRELVVPPTEVQLAALAWAMLPLEEAQSTADLVPLVQPSLAAGDPGLFGLYLTMRARPDLFENIDHGKRPRWVLTGPPPGACTPYYAAYDPETYEVLCLPGQAASPEMVERLRDLGLLKAVVQAS